MQNIIDIFYELKNTSGRLDKEEILYDNGNNEDFKYYLKFLLDPFIITGISKKKLSKSMKNKTKTAKCFNDFKEVTKYIQKNNTGADSTVAMVAAFIKLQPKHQQEFYESMIRKDLKVGLQATTVNKVYGKAFISQFKLQLAKKYEDEVDKIQGEAFVLTEKLDGARVALIVSNKGVKAFSRQGKPILGLVDIEYEASFLPYGVYDGELLIANANEYKDRDVLQETLKVARKDGEKTGLIAHIFDYVTLAEFEKGESECDYDVRRYFLEGKITSQFNWIQLLPVLYKGKDHSIIPDMLKELENEGKEGLMLNVVEGGKWVNKRTSNLLKIKSMNTMDVRLLYMVEGEGKYEGMLGKIVVDYKAGELGCGSGFSDKQRKEMWNNQEGYIGKICEIQYFRESRNDSGGLSVSFPIYLGMRPDKSEPSYY